MTDRDLERGGTQIDDDAVRPVSVLTAAWVAALVTLAIAGDALGVDDPDRWRAIAAAGVTLGIIGIVATRRRRAVVRRQGRDRGSPSG